MSTVIGSDGISPVYDPEGLWKTWSVWEIWMGPTHPGAGRFVPKIKDYVIDPDTYETWIVDHLDPVSLTPTLRAVRPAGMNYSLTDEDILFGVGPGSQTETFRAYLNDSVFPHTLVIEPRWMPKGTMSSYAKIFLGVNTGPTGEVISKVYDASGNFVSVNVPLEIVALDSHTNYAAKIVQRCNVTRKMVNGERVTVVIYADDGHVVERRQFLIENTDTVADLHASVKYVSEISLESVWLSPTAPDEIHYPLNIPMDALNMMGVVHYSDGSKLKLPVNGGKFSMMGLEGIHSSIPGGANNSEPRNLVLRYILSPGETAYASTGVNSNYVVKPYRLVIVNPNESIAVKLFGYPFWEGESFGYRMRWFLLNLARNIKFEVTPYVQYSSTLGPYDPKLYGYIQRKLVTINLRDVSGAFIPYIHTQLVDIVLNGPADSDEHANWTVATQSSDQQPRYGEHVWGKITGDKVNFKADHGNYVSWLKAFYEDTGPLTNPAVGTEVLTPSHFVVDYGGQTTEWPMAMWDKDLNIAGVVATKTTAVIRFIKRTTGGDLQLSYAAAMLK